TARSSIGARSSCFLRLESRAHGKRSWTRERRSYRGAARRSTSSSTRDTPSASSRPRWSVEVSSEPRGLSRESSQRSSARPRRAFEHREKDRLGAANDRAQCAAAWAREVDLATVVLDLQVVHHRKNGPREPRMLAHEREEALDCSTIRRFVFRS